MGQSKLSVNFTLNIGFDGKNNPFSKMNKYVSIVKLRMKRMKAVSLPIFIL